MTPEHIHHYIHCGACLDELPTGASPAKYQRIQAGWTEKGLQVVCMRHGCNIIHIDFEGHKHPADISAYTVNTAPIDVVEYLV